jgi:hypothetical protein
MLLLLTGFGATSLTMVTIADDMAHIRSEFLQGASAGDQVLARILSRLPFGMVTGLAAAFLFSLLTDPAQALVIPEVPGYALVLCAYTASCTALGVLISTLGSSVKSVVAWVVAILGGLVIAADLAMRIDGIPVVGFISYLFPSRYAAGFLGANIGLDTSLPIAESRGWTWEAESMFALDVTILATSVVVYSLGASAITIARIKRWRSRG